MPESEAPPVYLALDLWQALDLPIGQFEPYYERNGWANTWANLLAEVRWRSGRRTCPIIANGEPCVLIDRHIGPHMGASDVGLSEPLPAGDLEIRSAMNPTLTQGQLLDGFRIALTRMEQIEGPRFSDRLAMRSLRAVIADLTAEPDHEIRDTPPHRQM